MCMYSLCHLFGRSETNFSQLPSDKGHMKQDQEDEWSTMHPSVPSRCTARHAKLAKRQFVCSPPEPRICEIVRTPFFRGHPRVTRKTPTLGTPPSYPQLTVQPRRVTPPPFCNLPPQGRSDPVMELDQSHLARRRVIGRVIGRGSKCKCKCKTFLRLLDRRMKAKSDAPFVLSLFCILSL